MPIQTLDASDFVTKMSIFSKSAWFAVYMDLNQEAAKTVRIEGMRFHPPLRDILNSIQTTNHV